MVDSRKGQESVHVRGALKVGTGVATFLRVPPFRLALVLVTLAFASPSPMDAGESTSPGFLLRLGMSEREVIYRAGVPDVVQLTLSWNEFEALRARGASIGSVEYDLNYNSIREGLRVLNGPLGVATQCGVGISEGKVISLMWTHRTESGDSAKRALLGDNSYEVRNNGRTLIRTKRSGEGDVLAIVQVANSSETTVMVTPR